MLVIHFSVTHFLGCVRVTSLSLLVSSFFLRPILSIFCASRFFCPAYFLFMFSVLLAVALIPNSTRPDTTRTLADTFWPRKICYAQVLLCRTCQRMSTSNSLVSTLCVFAFLFLVCTSRAQNIKLVQVITIACLSAMLETSSIRYSRLVMCVVLIKMEFGHK